VVSLHVLFRELVLASHHQSLCVYMPRRSVYAEVELTNSFLSEYQYMYAKYECNTLVYLTAHVHISG
jgi:hypothetical protein